MVIPNRRDNSTLFSFNLFFAMTLFMVPVTSTKADSAISISGTVLAPPACTVNGGGTVSVDFGTDLLTLDIDGTNFSQRVKYSYDCKKSNVWLKMRIDGTPFINTDALDTSKSDLGIAFRANGTLLRIGQSLAFSSESAPFLIATPVKRSGSVLKGGPFFASATLVIEFQ